MIDWLARITATVGGLMVVALIVMTCLSILGRGLISLGLGPVPGDYELIEAGMAFAIFCFLPLCQLEAAHATVDVFTAPLGGPINRLLLALWDVLFTAALILITWRLYEGMLGKLGNGETTMFLQFHLWWAYAACLPPALIAVIVGLWSSADRLRAVVTGVDLRAEAHEAHP
jgi:TRAP-type C4-dicarboxylate transport system permease small subunit